MAYAAPGITLANILSRVSSAMGSGWETSDSTAKAKMYEAIAQAGAFICQYDPNWWFLQSNNTFTTTDGTASYNLRTVNSNAMTDIAFVRQMWLEVSATDRRRIDNVSYDEYMRLIEMEPTESDPEVYAIAGDNVAYLHPTPSTSSVTVRVYFTKRHGALSDTSTAAELLVPAELHYQVYIQGALWLLRHNVIDAQALVTCPAIAEAIGLLRKLDPTARDYSSKANGYPDQVRATSQWLRYADGHTIVPPSAL